MHRPDCKLRNLQRLVKQTIASGPRLQPTTSHSAIWLTIRSLPALCDRREGQRPAKSQREENGQRGHRMLRRSSTRAGPAPLRFEFHLSGLARTAQPATAALPRYGQLVPTFAWCSRGISFLGIFSNSSWTEFACLPASRAELQKKGEAHSDLIPCCLSTGLPERTRHLLVESLSHALGSLVFPGRILPSGPLARLPLNPKQQS